MLADSLSRLLCLGLYKDNDPKKTGCEYGRSIVDTDIETACNVDISQNINKGFEIESVRYYLDEKDLKDLPY